MDWQTLLAEAKKAGEKHAFSWWTSAHSDGPVDPAGNVHVELTDPAQAAEVIALGEAVAVDGGARLKPTWEHEGDRLEYARAYAEGFGAVLSDKGVPTRTVEALASQDLDTGSLERGLEQLMHLGRISVADFLADRPVLVTRVADGPFVLEIPADLRAHPACDAFLDQARAEGFEIKTTDDSARVNMSRDSDKALPLIVKAIATLRDSPTTTLIARFSPGRARPW